MHLNVLPARTGFAWARAGLRTFRRQPLALTGLFMLFMVLLSCAALVPVVGPVLTLILLPAATLGMMAATRDADAGKPARPAALFAAFRAGPGYARPMLLLGVFYALGFGLMLAVSALVDGGDYALSYISGNRASAGPNDIESYYAMCAMLVLYVPLSLLFWHAPALVYWYRISPAKSLFFSFVACMRNMGAFTTYAIAWMGIFLAGGLIIGTATTLLLLTGLLGDTNSAAAMGITAGVITLAALVLAAMFFTSLYFTFLDCFVHPTPAADTDVPASDAA